MAIEQASSGTASSVDKALAAAATAEKYRAAMRGKRFDTIAVHGIYSMEEALANQGSIIEPAHFSTSQHFEDSQAMEEVLSYRVPGWIYSRVANPTVRYLEETLALLEGYDFDGRTSACATSSGMAAVWLATSPFLRRVGGTPDRRPNLVASARCYGGTFMLFNERYGAEQGVDVRWVHDPLDLTEWARNIDSNTRFVYGESPSNPGLSMFDIAPVARLAHEHGVPLIVDSTVATPALMRPLCFGADIVVQSLSKCIGASGLAIAGAVVSRQGIFTEVLPDDLRADFATACKLQTFRDHGPALSPMSALLILSDLRTLRHRVDQFSRSAMAVAEFLASHAMVEHVEYPGLPGSSCHEIARKLLWLVDGDQDGASVNRFGHLLSFTTRGGAAAARATLDALRLIWHATDLGRVKSVATIPAISTHQQQGEAGRSLASIPDNLIRLSVGGEDTRDLIDDLAQALSAAR